MRKYNMSNPLYLAFSFCILVMSTGCAESSEKIENMELKIILQKTIDLNILEKYYHIDQLPERKPLVLMVNNVLKTGIKLEKFGVPVLFENEKNILKSKKPYLEFTKIIITKNTAMIESRYPVEGIVGVVSFNKDKRNRWVILQSKIVER